MSAPVLGVFGNLLAGLTWVSDLLVGGSLATGDYMPGVSDLDLVHRALSRVARAELVGCGVTVFGRRPLDVLPAMSHDDVREAAQVELTGYWAWAVRHPLIRLDPVLADLSLTSMARGRHTLRTGGLLTKTRAVDEADAPAWLIDQMRARRHGQGVTSPRLRMAVIAWQDARRTVARATRTPS